MYAEWCVFPSRRWSVASPRYTVDLVRYIARCGPEARAPIVSGRIRIETDVKEGTL